MGFEPASNLGLVRIATVADAFVAAGWLGLFVRDSTVTPVPLEHLPSQIRYEACRWMRAQLGAEVVITIMPKPDGTGSIGIYGESAARHRFVIVEGGTIRESRCPRQDLFRAADPRIAAYLRPQQP